MNPHCKTRLPLVVLVMLTGCGPTAMTDADRSAAEAELIQMGYLWEEAYTSGDFSPLDQIFAEDLIYTGSDGSMYGKEDFITFLQTEHKPDSLRDEGGEIRWYGSTAVETGVAAAYVTYEGGVVQRYATSYTHVLVERDGRWQIIVGHASDAK